MSKDKKIQFRYGDKVIINPTCTFEDDSMRTQLEAWRDNRIVGVIESRLKKSVNEHPNGNIPVRFPDEPSLVGFLTSELLPAPTPTEARITEITQHIDEVGMVSNQEEAELGRLTAEQEDEWADYQNSLAPTQTAEEAELENKSATVEEFVRLCNELIDSIDELAAVGITPFPDGNDFDDLRNAASTAAYRFNPDLDDHNRE